MNIIKFPPVDTPNPQLIYLCIHTCMQIPVHFYEDDDDADILEVPACCTIERLLNVRAIVSCLSIDRSIEREPIKY